MLLRLEVMQANERLTVEDAQPLVQGLTRLLAVLDG
jgi:hypothetical protein